MIDFPALLLTDIVGSTALTKMLGDAAMAELWSARDRFAGDLLTGLYGETGLAGMDTQDPSDQAESERQQSERCGL